jgi:hypothetical protein
LSARGTFLGGALAAAMAIAPAGAAGGDAGVSAARHGRSLLVVGDSLAVGTRPYIRRYLRGWRVHQRTSISMQVTEGPHILHGYGRHLPRVVFVNLGTNGGPRDGGTFVTAIRRTMRIAGPKRCVVWASIVRPRVGGASYQGLNRLLAHQARHRRNLIMFRWVRLAHRHRSWFGPDGVHPTATGYQVRAKAMARDIRSCRRVALHRHRHRR